MKIISVLIPLGIICFIYLNIAPLIFSDTFGHYLRIKTIVIVESDGVNLNTSIENEVVEEKCNPWLMFWRLAKLKPCTVEYKFDSKETERIWNLINHK